MKFSKVFLTALLAGLSLFAPAAELTFDLKIEHSGEAAPGPGGAMQDRKQIQRARKKTIAVFVIDCSGSMRRVYKDAKGRMYFGKTGKGPAWKRYQEIRDRKLPERFAALPLGTHVYAYFHCFRGGDWGVLREGVLTTPEAKAGLLAELQREITARMPAPGRSGAATLYYDTWAFALEKIRSAGWLRDPNVYLEFFNWSDGKNNTGGWTRYRKKTGEWADVKYMSIEGHQRYAAQLEEAKEKFEHDWGGVLKRIEEKKAEGKAFSDFLNVGTKGESDVKQTSEYRVDFLCGKKVLGNLQERLGLIATFPLDEANWQLLLKQKGPWGVKVRFDGGGEQVYGISPGKSASFKVAVPELKGKAAKVTISFVCPKIVPGEFTLFLPKPVEFYLSAPAAKATIERVEVQNTTFGNGDVRTVLAKDENGKSEKVFFMAEGTAKEYVWHFDDGVTLRSANGEAVSRTFGKVRDCKFTAFPKDNNESKIQGTIRVVAIGIELAQPKGSLLTGRKVSFEAGVPRGNLKPSSCVWYVTGPLGEARSAAGDGAGKAAGEKGKAGTDDNEARASGSQKSYSFRLDSKTLESSHVFEEPGKYTVMVRAYYDGLDQTREQLRQLVVREPLAIEFEGMESDNARLDFQKQIKLQIKATKGELGSVVWKANGSEIKGAGKAYMYDPRKKGTVEFEVVAEDAAVRGRKVRKTITYRLGCGVAEPKVRIVDKETGKETWGVGAKVDFAVDSAADYADIKWVIGDGFGAVSEVKAVNGHVIRTAVKGGRSKHTMTCVCSKCKERFEITRETETGTSEPEAVLELTPQKTSYSRDDVIHLRDAGKGDYFWCRLQMQDQTGTFRTVDPKTGKFEEKILKKNFSDVDITLGGEEFPVLQASPRTDFVFRLQALDRDGKTVLKDSAVRKVRVRNALAAWVILGSLCGLLLGLFIVSAYYLWGNKPRAWKFYYLESPKILPKDKYRELPATLRDGIFSESLDRRWKRGARQAAVPLCDLLDDSTEHPNPDLVVDPAKKETPLFFRSNSDADLPLPILKSELPGTTPEEYGAIYKVLPFSPKGENDSRILYLALLLDMSKKYRGDLICFWIVWLLVFAALAVAGLWLFTC